MDPITMAAVVTAGASLAGSGISAIGGANMNKKNRDWSSKENELNRQFQADQAQLSRQWQEDFYNQYSSPSAMVKQYQNAGLNPALMYGSGQSTGSIPSGASPSGGSSISPSTVNPLDSFSHLGAMVSDMFRLKNEMISLDYDNKVKLEQAKDLAASALLKGQSLKVGEKQVEEITQRIENLKKDYNLTEEQINILKKEALIMDYDKDLKEYQVKVNKGYEQISKDLGLPFAVTEQIMGHVISAAGSVIGGSISGFSNIAGNFLNTFLGKGKGKGKGRLPRVGDSNFYQPTLKFSPDNTSAYPVYP